jgi:putative membrane protein
MRMTVAAAAFLVVAGTAALAQQNAPALAQQKSPAASKAPAASIAFARKAAGANAFEIKSSELAQERAQSSEVKAFAKQMVDDHTKIGQDFKDAVQAANIPPRLLEQPDAKQKAALAKLQRAHGPAFDRAYLTAQLGGHKEAVSLLRKYSKSGRTPQLKEFAEKTLPTVERHLSEVTELNNRAIAAAQSRTGSGSRAIGPPAEKAPGKVKKQ